MPYCLKSIWPIEREKVLILDWPGFRLWFCNTSRRQFGQLFCPCCQLRKSNSIISSASNSFFFAKMWKELLAPSISGLPQKIMLASANVKLFFSVVFSFSQTVDLFEMIEKMQVRRSNSAKLWDLLIFCSKQIISYYLSCCFTPNILWCGLAELLRLLASISYSSVDFKSIFLCSFFQSAW